MAQGKVRYIGASNYVAFRLTRALWKSDKRGFVRYESIQPKYNFVVRDEYERELEALCAGRRDPLCVAEPEAQDAVVSAYVAWRVPP